MSLSDILPPTEPDGQLMPLAFRWFAVLGQRAFKPWYLDYDYSPGRVFRTAFRVESGFTRDLVPFAFRQDNDDTAGFEVVNGQITDRVIAFHPTWSNRTEDFFIDGDYEDLWSFMSQAVIGDMKDWANEEDWQEMIEEKGDTIR